MNEEQRTPDAYVRICIEEDCGQPNGRSLISALAQNFDVPVISSQRYEAQLEFFDHHISPPVNVIVISSSCLGLCGECPASRVVKVTSGTRPDFWQKVDCPSASVEAIISTIRDLFQKKDDGSSDVL